MCVDEEREIVRGIGRNADNQRQTEIDLETDSQKDR